MAVVLSYTQSPGAFLYVADVTSSPVAKLARLVLSARGKKMVYACSQSQLPAFASHAHCMQHEQHVSGCISNMSMNAHVEYRQALQQIQAWHGAQLQTAHDFIKSSRQTGMCVVLSRQAIFCLVQFVLGRAFLVHHIAHDT